MTPLFRSRRTSLPVLSLTNPIRDPFLVLIARRAQRICNRDRAAAQRYEAAHLALKAQTKGQT